MIAALQQQNSADHLWDLNNSSTLTAEVNEKRTFFLKCELSIVCFIFITKLTCITPETVGNTDESWAKGFMMAQVTEWLKKCGCICLEESSKLVSMSKAFCQECYVVQGSINCWIFIFDFLFLSFFFFSIQ